MWSGSLVSSEWYKSWQSPLGRSDVFSVPFVGTVVSGVILSGKMAVGDEVLLGPDSLGHFALTTIKSMQRKRVNVEHAVAGQSVSISLKRIKRSGVRKGMVILSKTLEPPPRAVKKFEGQILILYHNSTVSSSLVSFFVFKYILMTWDPWNPFMFPYRFSQTIKLCYTLVASDRQ